MYHAFTQREEIHRRMDVSFGTSFLPDQDALEALEVKVQQALKTLSMDALQVLGFGETTIVLRLDTPTGPLACKRFPPMRHKEGAQAHADLITSYIDVLAERGVNTIDSACMIIEAKDGSAILYLIQPLLDASRIGPKYFSSLDEEARRSAFHTLLTHLQESVRDEVAPDGQLSNWAFLDDGIYYLDVTTPFIRNEQGELITDLIFIYETSFGGLLRPIRPYFKWKIPIVVDSYFSLRGQLVDLLANLRKEQLDELIPPLMQQANEHLAFDPPINMDDVKRYYNENADTYELLMRLYRLNRWFHRTILRKTYPSFIPPKINRNKY